MKFIAPDRLIENIAETDCRLCKGVALFPNPYTRALTQATWVRKPLLRGRKVAFWEKLSSN